MNLQEQLSKKTSGKYYKKILRLFIVLLNPLLLSLIIPNKKFNTLMETARVALINILLISQTLLTTPEIDSKNEELRL